MTLSSKTKRAVLITGGAKRIGQAIALYLSQEGFDIALHYHKSKAKAEISKRQIKKKGGRCQLFCCDLQKEKEVLKLVNNAKNTFPQLNLLINNASVFNKSTIKSDSSKNFDQEFNINLKAPFLLTQQFAKTIKKGAIINLLDTHITANTTQHTIYLLTKKGLADLTKLSATELAPQIRVNAVAPGLIIPPENKSYNHLDRLAKNIPLKRKGNISNITQSVKFLIENDFLTGQVIYCDGGEHLL